MKPSIGRIVHYIPVCYPPNEDALAAPDMHCAAIITHVYKDNGSVILTHFNRDGSTESKRPVLEDPTGKQPGTWHWPEREE